MGKGEFQLAVSLQSCSCSTCLCEEGVGGGGVEKTPEWPIELQRDLAEKDKTQLWRGGDRQHSTPSQLEAIRRLVKWMERERQAMGSFRRTSSVNSSRRG